MITLTGERLDRWARALGYAAETDVKVPEFRFWRLAWADKRRGPKVAMAVGGFCPIGYRRTEDKHPYLWVYTDPLENFRVKETERVALAHGLRAALGDEARRWDADGVVDDSTPLGRYLTDVSDGDRAQLISSPDRLFDFVTANVQPLFAIADIVEAEVAKIVK